MNKKMYFKTLLLTVAFSVIASTCAWGSTEGTLTGDRVNVRSGPNTSAAVLTQYNTGQKVTVLAKEGDWCKISYGNNATAYIFSQYVKIADASAVKTTAAPAETGGTSKGADIVKYAKQFLGNPYVYGGTSLTKGTDCSGFTKSIFNHFGYRLDRSSYAQYDDGTNIKVSELLPGDLVFFGYGDSISHVAIYIGDSKIIHASTSSTGIIISGLYERGNKPLIGCTRIL